MKEILNILKSLSDETRLRILNLLYEKELCVCDIMEVLQITQTKASRHLTYMKNAGLVNDRKQAQWAYYSMVQGDTKKLLDCLVFEYLRKLPRYNEDLKILNEWLQKKVMPCKSCDS